MSALSIINYLTWVSNNNLFVNFAMHLVVLAAVSALYIIKKENIKRFLVNAALLVLFASVTLHGAIYGNPFHTITFGLLVLVTLYELIAGKNSFSTPSLNLRTGLSYLFIITGFWYPEFVATSSINLVMLSPLGIVPCPTILTALGLLTLAGKNNKAQLGITILMAVIYGIIGTFVLKVRIDLLLMALAAFSTYLMYSPKSLSRTEEYAHSVRGL